MDHLEALAGLDLTAKEVAEALAAAIEPVALGKLTHGRVGHHEIWLKRYKGTQPCPFPDDPGAGRCEAAGSLWLGSMDWRIRNRATGAEESGPGLLVHLIGGHGFFEGLESPYRVGPEALARLLDMGPYSKG